MELRLEKVQKNAEVSDTEELLNRITVFRSGMEPDAIIIIEDELRRRGISAQHIAEHSRKHEGVVLCWDDGCAACCSFCREPAIATDWGWHKLYGKIPLFPKRYYYCQRHLPEPKMAPPVVDPEAQLRDYDESEME